MNLRVFSISLQQSFTVHLNVFIDINCYNIFMRVRPLQDSPVYILKIHIVTMIPRIHYLSWSVTPKARGSWFYLNLWPISTHKVLNEHGFHLVCHQKDIYLLQTWVSYHNLDIGIRLLTARLLDPLKMLNCYFYCVWTLGFSFIWESGDMYVWQNKL